VWQTSSGSQHQQVFKLSHIGRRCPAPPWARMAAHTKFPPSPTSLPCQKAADWPGLRGSVAIVTGDSTTAASSVDQQTRRKQHRLATAVTRAEPGRAPGPFAIASARIGGAHSSPRVTDVSSLMLSFRGQNAALQCALPLLRNLHAPKGTAPCSGTTAYFALCPCAASDVSWDRSPNLPEVSMLSSEQRVQIVTLFYAEHWKVGTIAQELGVHPDHRPPCAGHRAVQSCKAFFSPPW